MKNFSVKAMSQYSEQWLYSLWFKETRFYAIELSQDIFSHWIVTCTWGRYKTQGAGQSKTMECDDYDQALEIYHQEQTRRLKRGYVMQQENSQIEES
ncbi:MAG: WGR domain-containing protein [Xenococcus sp. MO_188.B8]|nr:WGR domain-containing protein [Xenococcus sp. MO_188.B8]